MDLIFCEGTGTIAFLIEHISSPYSHVGFVMTINNKEFVFESQAPAGVRCVPLTYYKSIDKAVYRCTVTGWDEKQTPAFMQSCMNDFGDVYSYREIWVLMLRLVLGIRLNYHASKTAYICSEWVANKLLLWNIDLAVPGDTALVSPGLLAKSPVLTNWRKIF